MGNRIQRRDRVRINKIGSNKGLATNRQEQGDHRTGTGNAVLDVSKA